MSEMTTILLLMTETADKIFISNELPLKVIKMIL